MAVQSEGRGHYQRPLRRTGFHLSLCNKPQSSTVSHGHNSRAEKTAFVLNLHSSFSLPIILTFNNIFLLGLKFFVCLIYVRREKDKTCRC